MKFAWIRLLSRNQYVVYAMVESIDNMLSIDRARNKADWGEMFYWIYKGWFAKSVRDP